MTAVAVLALGVSSAHGTRGSGPIARIACARTATNCSESGSITLPPNSFGSQSTDTVPDGSTVADTSLGISNTDTQDLNAFDETWAAVVDTFPKLGTIKSKPVRRVITCALMAAAAADSMAHAYDSEEQFNTERPGYYETVLAICVQAAVAGQGNFLTAGAAAATARRCTTVLVSIPVVLQRVGSRYRAIVKAKTYKARSRGPLSVSCRPKGTGIKITLKPRARHAKLRSVTGPQLSIGFSNPSNRSLNIHTKYSFR